MSGQLGGDDQTLNLVFAHLVSSDPDELGDIIPAELSEKAIELLSASTKTPDDHSDVSDDKCQEKPPVIFQL